MSIPVGAQGQLPNINPANGAGHQTIRAMPTYIGGSGGGVVPVPVAAALKGGVTGVAYSEAITAQGGTPPYSFAVTSGSLPTGCTMTSGGIISGVPTVAASFTFTVTVTDSLAIPGSQSFTIIIASPSAGGGNKGYAFGF